MNASNNNENPYLLISSNPINSLNQIRDVIEYVKTNNRPLIIVAEEITKEIISTLVLNNIQKKFSLLIIVIVGKMLHYMLIVIKQKK